MSQQYRRHRKSFSSVILGLWVFALFVGIANACSWDGVTAAPHHPTVADHAMEDVADHEKAPGCDKFCSNDVPMLSVLKLVQDQPAGQPVALATYHHLGVLPISAPALRLARSAHSPPGVPFSPHFVRLTL